MGCAAPERQAPVPGVVPDAGGLQPVGSDLRIDFGRAQAGVLAAVTRLKGAGPARVLTVEDCGEVAVWRDGLTLVFLDGTFLGWADGTDAAGQRCG